MGVPMIGVTFGDDTPRVRLTDPETAHEAADTNDVSASIGAVLDTLKQYGPQSDGDLHALMLTLGHKYTEQRVRTARAALVQARMVEHTGQYGVTSTNRRTRIWGIPSAEISRLNRLDGVGHAL